MGERSAAASQPSGPPARVKEQGSFAWCRGLGWSFAVRRRGKTSWEHTLTFPQEFSVAAHPDWTLQVDTVSRLLQRICYIWGTLRLYYPPSEQRFSSVISLSRTLEMSLHENCFDFKKGLLKRIPPQLCLVWELRDPLPPSPPCPPLNSLS